MTLEKLRYSHAFQPIIDLECGEIISYEILLRGPEGQPPGYVFDQVSLQNIIAFDQMSREKALSTASALGLNKSVNLNYSPGSILHDDGTLLEQTLLHACKVGIDASRLVIEITEDEAIHNLGLLKDILDRYRRKRLTIAIDDFGAGYAGLNMLADILPDIVKLDRLLIRNIHQHGPRQSIVRAINQVCLDLGIDLLAEGVESMAEFDYLKSIDIQLYQGYLFAKPGFEHFPEVVIPA